MITTCRGCHSPNLRVVLDLGRIGSAEYSTSPTYRSARWPLQFGQCLSCSLVQLVNAQRQDGIYHTYWYRSGVNEAMKAELKDVVACATAMVQFGPHDIAIDIGANDGTLLSAYHGSGFRVAYEPAPNLQGELAKHANQVYSEFFPSHLQSWEDSAKIVTAIACAYAVDDIHGFLAGVRAVLHKDGVAVIQFQDLKQMLDATAFDNICFEHLTYFSLASFEAIAVQHNLTVVKVERRAINGGSLRVYLQRFSPNWKAGISVDQIFAWELGCEKPARMDRFVAAVTERIAQIRGVVELLRRRFGTTIDLYGASTKANTLLQVCGLDHTEIRWAWERSEEKWGTYMAATGIPIVPEARGRRDPPDLLLAGIWQFREQILAREGEYLRRGGAVCFPLPVVDVVTGVGLGLIKE